MTLDELKKLAEAATPGPWDTWRDEGTGAHVIWNEPGGQIGRLAPLWIDTAKYVAAANPATVLKLLEMIAVYKEVLAEAVCCDAGCDDCHAAMERAERAAEIEQSL